MDERERRVEWGAEAGRDYSGWLTVANHGEGGSEMVAHLSFWECSPRRFDTTSDTTERATPRNIVQPPAKISGLGKPILQFRATLGNRCRRIVAPKIAGSSPVGHPFRFRIGTKEP